MARTITESGSTVRMAFDRPENGDPALLVSGNGNTIVVGFYGLRSTGGGPAVRLDGRDNYVRFDSSIVSAAGPVAVMGSAGADTIINNRASISGEVVLGDGNDYYQSGFASTQGAVRGGDGNDVLTSFQATSALDYWGDAGNDHLLGGSAADRLHGGSDDDLAQGGAGDDRLWGDGGRDRLEGGDGNDVLSGGESDDVAIFSGHMAGYRVSMAGGGGTVVDTETGDGDDGTDTLDTIEILRFRDQEVDLRIVRSELLLSTAGQSAVNDALRYGYNAVAITANGVQFTNGVSVRGTALAHTVTEGASLVQANTAAVEVAADGVRVTNRAGGSIVGNDVAIGSRRGYFTDAAGDLRAYARDLVVANSGSVRSIEGTAIEVVGNGLTLTNAAGGTIAARMTGVDVANGLLALTNAGTISGEFASIRGGVLNLVNTGSITGRVEALSRFSTVENGGTIAGGVLLYGVESMLNTGTISGGTTVDVYLVGYGEGYGDTRSHRFASIDNRQEHGGDIRVTGETQFRSASASAPVFTSVIANSGRVTGGIQSDATVTARANDGSTPSASFREEVTNSGRIDGDVDLGAGDDLLVNSGSIGGSVRLGAGDDRMRIDGGSVARSIDGGAGRDVLDWSASGVGGRFDLAAGTVTVGSTNWTVTGFEALVATAGSDVIVLGAQVTEVAGLDGDDAILMGAELTATDRIDGGAGLDQVGLQGNYAGANALALQAATLSNIEVLAVLPGGNYDVTSAHETVAAGQVFTVFGGNLGQNDSLTFDGSAETDGAFLMFGGFGVDRLTGGAGSDAFFFGPNRFGANDAVVGGAGIDQLGLDGLSADLTIRAANADVEVLALLRGPAGGENRYGIVTVDDSWVAAGQTKTITAVTSFQSSIGPVATDLVVDGSRETNGNLRIFSGSGNDTLFGGAGNDILFGGVGRDQMAGGAGADVFVFNAASDSNVIAGSGGSSVQRYDTLFGFDRAEDAIQVDGRRYGSYADVNGGRLSDATFNADLQAAAGAKLTGDAAVFFTATSGDHQGQTFLVVNTDGQPGYQAGSDLILQLAPASDLTPPPVVL